MRNLIAAMVLLSMLSLPGCTKVLYTHEQVFDSYKTKDQVVKRFGQPTERRATSENEQWLYSFQADNKAAGTNTDLKTADVTEFGYYQKYLVFTFDKQGNVIDRKAEGVNLTQKKKAPGRTIALIAGGVAAAAVVVWLAAMASAGSISSGSLFDW